MSALKYIENLFNTMKKSDQNGGPTGMAFGLAGSLIRNEGFDIDDIAESYMRWHKRDGFDAGPTASRVFQLVEKGMSFHKASEQVDFETNGRTAGCNPAHRAAALAILDVDEKELIGYCYSRGKVDTLASSGC